MNNIVQIPLFTIVFTFLFSIFQLTAQESTLNPDFLIFETTPASTQGSIYGLNGINIQNGNVGISIVPANGCKLDVGGTIHSNGNLTASDARFKNNIRPIKKSMEKLLEIQGVSYDYKTTEFKTKNFPETKQFGLIAQELETVFPELVRTFDDGYKAINYDGLIPVLIEALKTEHAEKEAQHKEIKSLKNDLETMQTEIQELKQILNKLSQNSHNASSSKIVLSDAQLFQNAPNPFNKNTTIQYFIPENIQKASLNLSNLKGQLMKSIPIDTRGKGEVLLEAYSLSSGQYIYSLVLDGKVLESRSMVLTQ